MADGRVEIRFPTDAEVAVSVLTDLEDRPGAAHDVRETAVFAALAAGVLANLSKDPGRTLGTRLAAVEEPRTDADIASSVDGFLLVLPSGRRGRKGFEGTFEMNSPLPVARWKPQGFRLFSKDVQIYSVTAIEALYLHVLAGFAPRSRPMLVETARTLGNLCLAGAIEMRNHPHAAIAALDRGVETAEPR